MQTQEWFSGRIGQMLAVFFCILFLWAIWKLLVLGIRATWDLIRLLCVILFIGLVLIGIICFSLISIVLPLFAGIIIVVYLLVVLV